MKKKKYRVEFWYATDLRAHFDVEARSSLGAVLLALERLSGNEDGEWCSEPPFEIRVHLVA